MRVAFVVQELSPSGGVNVIQAHARALVDAGHEADLVVPSEGEPPGGEYDWAIFTWWETAAPAFAIWARRRLGFLQSFEAFFYRDDEPFERYAASAVLGLPVDFVVVGEWMRELLAELVPGARCVTVRNGIDRERFGGPAPSRESGGPLRVLVEGEPKLWFKGIADAVAAVRAMREPAELTLVTPVEGGATAEALGADRLLSALEPAAMAELYRESDVLLKLSRIEGLSLPPLEGFHAGVPCVVTPYGGHAEYVRHGQNGLVVGFDDRPGTAAALDMLARDRDLLARLSAGALETAAEWPDTAEAGRQFVAALERLGAEPPPEPGQGAEQLLASLRTSQEHGRRLTGELEWTTGALEEARTHVHEASIALHDNMKELESAYADLDRIRSRLYYRVASRARALLRGRR